MSAGALVSWALLLAAAPDRVETSIEASISDDLERLTLVVRARYTPGVELDRVPVVLAAERYRALPELTPSEVREAFPGDFSPGGFDDLAITIDGEPCRAAPELLEDARVVRCPRAVVAGQTVEIEARATLAIPERYGGFGRVRRHVTLAGGWFPQPARPGAAPPRGPWSVRLDTPADMTVVIGERYRPSPGATGRRAVRAEGEGAQIPLVLRPGSAFAVSIADGAARFLTGPASAHLVPTELPTLAHEVRDAVEDALPVTRALGLPLPTPARPLVMIEAPLRHALTESAEGVVLVSDHAFRMMEIDRFLRFHRLPLLRDVFAQLALRALGPEVEGRGLTADVAGARALERYVVDRFGGAEDAFDLLGIVSFIPSIDQMLYAPDLPFAGAYFRNVPEAHALKPDFIDFPLGFPRGRHVYEKLRDRLGDARAAAIVERALDAGLVAAIRAEWPEGAAAFLGTWLGPYPAVRYQLHGIEETPGRAAITIERVGDEVAEPITVLVEDDDGVEQRLVATATTARLRTVTATLGAPLDLVVLDPARRLVEAPDQDAPDPRYFHRSDPEWKVLLNNFNILFAASEGSIETALDLGLARRNDVHWSFGLRGEYAPEALSLAARASYAFGPRITGARLAHSVSLSSEGAYLRPGFAGEEGGAAILIGAGYGYDDRASIWAPESGTALRVGASAQHIFGDLPEGATADAISISVRALRQWRIGLRNQLSVRGTWAAYVAGRPQAQLLFPLGGRANVRGYAQGDQLGRVRAVASVEWLHPLLTQLDIDFFSISWVSAIDGVLYADVAAVGEDLAGAFSDRPFGDVGYGARVYIDYFGVRPGVLAVDLAIPLVAPRGRAQPGGLAVYITFSQSFVGL